MDSPVRITTELEMIADYACATGENPLWHPEEQALYWTDIPAGRIFRYSPATGQHEQIYSGRTVGGFTFRENGGLLLFMDRGTIASLHEGVLTELLTSIPVEESSRFNDVIADPAGRVFGGTMSSESSKGRLYRLDTNGTLYMVLEGIGCSNGMAFSADSKSFFYTDSFAHEIYEFDFDALTGSILNQRVFARFTEADGLPDGITIDSEGHIWCALWDGGCVIRLSRTGEIEERIAVSAPKSSSLTFGGEQLSDIYITTAGGDQRKTDGAVAGALFRVRSTYKGRPEFFSRISVPAIALASTSSTSTKAKA